MPPTEQTFRTATGDVWIAEEGACVSADREVLWLDSGTASIPLDEHGALDLANILLGWYIERREREASDV